ncbi:MAG: phosphoribosylanthranilate isomerase [Rhodobacteraceae bacterium]|nr:phosphoribosylanthranilate isomerase [Paracoccaceae bacterium]
MKVKICGLRSPRDVAVATAAGATYVGFVFFPPSPRHLELDKARELAQGVPNGVTRVALTVDADDATLADILANVPIDMIQMHGTEHPVRVAEVRATTGRPVMKAVAIAAADDLKKIQPYEAVADQILVDAKPPEKATRPGGNGAAFDWGLIAGRSWQKPWMLAGGLTPQNIAAAVTATGVTQLDVSSSLESSPGVKDPARIRAFLQAALGGRAVPVRP